MSRRSLALVANFHKERRIGRKTANFLGAVHARLQDRDIDFNIEFVLDRPDDATVAQIEEAARSISGARIHQVDFGNLGSSRTFGVNAARADVVCFTDGDDFFSLDWFEGALNFFSGGLQRSVLHTQYMVGFDNEQFIRETTQSIDPWFDPLALAVDWYWSANLAIQAEVFASSPIQPYDHDRGFGSEDWHWTCDSLHAGIERVVLPNTSYFYRVKPEKFALGRVADVIHMASPLLDRARLPARRADFATSPPPIRAPGPDFYAQAREVERFELGLSYLRAVEVGAERVRHFRPHTSAIVGTVIRAAAASGFGDGSTIVFADSQRLPGGAQTASNLVSALAGPPLAGRLYVVDGDRDLADPGDGYVLRTSALREGGLYNEQINRLIARFLIQYKDLTVVNLVSPRSPSRALAYSRATRGSVARWVNLIAEYGYDALSRSCDELDQFAAAGIEAENIAVFRQTVVEAWDARGVRLGHSPTLEARFVAGGQGEGRVDDVVWPGQIACGRADGATGERAVVLRVCPAVEAADRGEGCEGPYLRVDQALREAVRDVAEVVVTGGDAFLGETVGIGRRPDFLGVRVAALTVVHQDKPPAYFFRPKLETMNLALTQSRMPTDLAFVGAFGVAGEVLRDLLPAADEPLPVAALLAEGLRRGLRSGGESLALFERTAVVSVSASDLERLGGTRLLRDVSRRLAQGGADE